MKTLEEARRRVREALSGAESPAVFWSAGKDSSLLLHLAREARPDVVCLWFRAGLTPGQERFARRQIAELDLHVWGWAPADVYVVPNGDGLSLVREQSFGTHAFPVLSDVEDGRACIFDFPEERTPVLFPHFDALLLGYKDSDYHEALGGSGFCPEDGWRLGRAKVYAPLRHMSDADVWEAIRASGVPYDAERYDRGGPDPDTLRACTRCLQAGEGAVFCPKAGREVPRGAWDRGASLSAFRERFQLRKVA